MTNRPTLQPTARVGDDPTTRRLRELAAQEAAATKERLATRTAAARLFSGAVARLAETKAAWERAQAEAQRAQAEAVEDLLVSGLQPDEVAELLGISNRELRSLRATRPDRPMKASGPMNGSESHPMNGSVAPEAQSTHLRLSPAHTTPSDERGRERRSVCLCQRPGLRRASPFCRRAVPHPSDRYGRKRRSQRHSGSNPTSPRSPSRG